MGAMTDEVRRAVRERIRILGTSQNKVAQELGMKPVNLSRMLSGRSGSLPRNWARLLDHLGLEITVRPKGSGEGENG